MTPYERTKTRRRTRKFKKKKSQKQQVTTDFSASCIDSEVAEVSTPKGQKFRIPEVSTCPPAPKKKPRLLSSNYCSLRRSPLQLFASLELEIFFSIALPEVSVSSIC
ncbi:PREDICTED: cyclin-dependent protein kinase inhibitor SMR2-like [Lupinus angustifolius]|uniref:cyclin-dependent protein kinase inhibitor SMR2-like n=1 Tax=Lupinus angustifolius TaxID=3871 RepID=UPI00092FD000|nr:PREDICTED: cyclin-dependent protein kinase inhibitor SMR2-like [Lupinus angustifolius]